MKFVSRMVTVFFVMLVISIQCFAQSDKALLTGLSQNTFFSMGQEKFQFTLTGKNIRIDDKVVLDPANLPVSFRYINDTSIAVEIQQCQPICDFGLTSIKLVDANGAPRSNVLTLDTPAIGLMGSCGQDLCWDLHPEEDGGKFYLYSFAPLGVVACPVVGNGALSMAYDPTSGRVLITALDRLMILNADGSGNGDVVFPIPGGTRFVANPARGIGAASTPSGQIIFVDLTAKSPELHFMEVGHGFHAGPIDMVETRTGIKVAAFDPWRGEIAVFSLGSEEKQIIRHRVFGIQKLHQLKVGQGGWLLKFFGDKIVLVPAEERIAIVLDLNGNELFRTSPFSSRPLAITEKSGKAQIALANFALAGSNILGLNLENGEITQSQTLIPFAPTMVDGLEKTTKVGSDFFFASQRERFGIFQLM